MTIGEPVEPFLEEKFHVRSKTIAHEKHPERNEDFLLENRDNGLFAAFDGMGEPPAGDVASAMAAKSVNEELERLPKGISPQEISDAIKNALVRANQKIVETVAPDPDKYENQYGGMGTTASVVKIWEGVNGEKKAIIGNVGDSRVYKCHADGKLEQITLDDNILRDVSSEEIKVRRMQEKFNNTMSELDIDPKEQELFDRRNDVSQYIGRKKGIKPRMHIVDLKEGDRIIIMSDGIGDNLSDNEMEKILRESKKSNQNDVENLINASLERSRTGHFRAKQDDMSAIVIEFVKNEQPQNIKTKGDKTDVIDDDILDDSPFDDSAWELKVPEQINKAEKEANEIFEPPVEKMNLEAIEGAITELLDKTITCSECDEKHKLTAGGGCPNPKCRKISDEDRRLDALLREKEIKGDMGGMTKDELVDEEDVEVAPPVAEVDREIKEEKEKASKTTWAGNAARWVGDSFRPKTAWRMGKAGATFGLFLGYWLFILTTHIAEEGTSFSAKSFVKTIDEAYGTKLDKALGEDK